ncbi:MAG TPA: ABC transporter substrate-binding protein [Nocardioides sp.]|uniref:ABC transporter substrate-binding protein n=1 Tax=Nocardioides sp. TaxID=35761 RepID=UPI002C04ECC0|nr:ABC transporter substrate-binding protein [Nocardioides sp.]HTW18303.1 ABC transporter substrate-binding protein [Nocardioides sp.]
MRAARARSVRRTRGWAAGSVLLLALSAALAGCGGESSGGSGDAGRDTIRVAVAEPVGDLNPWDFLGQFHAMDLVYDPLVAYGEGGELEPALAESWEVSEDGRMVTFALRQGVTFHDGTAFDAEAAKFNIEQWAGQEKFSFLGAATVISSIETPDEHTLVLKLSEAYPPLIQELTIVRPVRFVSPTSAEGGNYTEPVGTGPWVYESSTDTTGAFARNEDYWGEKPSLEHVEMKVIPDSQTRLSALRSGEVDLIGGGYLAPINAVEAQTVEGDSSLELLTGDADTTMSLIFNPRGPLADPAVREAVSLATDVESINNVLYGGTDNVARGYFPPTVPHSGTPVERAFDPDAAAQVLDDAGWALDGKARSKDGKPLELELLLVSDPVHGMMDSRTVGQALQDAFAKVGIGVELRVVDGAAYFDEEAAGNFDLAFSTTYGAPYDPTNTVLSFLTSDAETPTWTTPELDGLVEAAVAAREPADLDAAYQAIYDYLEEASAFVPITNPPRYYAVRSEVDGFEIPPHEYHLDLTGVTIG